MEGPNVCICSSYCTEYVLQGLNNDRRSTREAFPLSLGGSSKPEMKGVLFGGCSPGVGSGKTGFHRVSHGLSQMERVGCRKTVSDASLGDGDDLRPS